MIPIPRLGHAVLLLLAAGAAGCGAFAEPPPPTATPTPSPTPTPRPQLEMPVLHVAQGGAAVVRVSGSAASAGATFLGRTFPLLPRPGGFWGVIGVAADHPAGSEPLAVVLRGRAGRVTAELSASVTVTDAAFAAEAISLAPERSGLLDPALAEQEQAARAAVFAVFTPERLWSGPFLLPVQAVVSSPYGIGRSYNGGPVASFHRGVDFRAAEGTPVLAANSGRVALSGPLPLRGDSVIIDHGAGVFSGYHHLAGAAVALGQQVSKGDVVGYVGNSGVSTGPHLHWEIVVGGITVDPLPWAVAEVLP